VLVSASALFGAPDLEQAARAMHAAAARG
jgi:hypothetical protein